MEITKLSSKGQVVIPQKIREKLKMEEGAVIGIEKVNNMVVMKKIDASLVNQFKRSLEDLKSKRVRRAA
jgi:AbrB family looped-hinge helix DNA binding protein